jgi:hypothetical protein
LYCLLADLPVQGGEEPIVFDLALLAFGKQFFEITLWAFYFARLLIGLYASGPERGVDCALVLCSLSAAKGVE